MATLFEPSFSASTIRAPLSSADAPSMADSLPSIDFGFDQLRERMARFTDRFDAFIAKGRKRVLEERNHFRINAAELQEDQKMKRRDLEIMSQKHAQHAVTMEQQEAETAEIQGEIATLTGQRDEAVTKRNTLQTQIATLKSEISARQAAQSAHSREVDAQARLNVPELDFWETYLGLRIEGTGKADCLRFVFCNLDERDWAREAWFELDTERREYGVAQWRPKEMEKGRIDECLEGLNTSRDLGQFLRKIRVAFKEAMQVS